MERLQLTAKKNNFPSKDLTSHYSMANLVFFLMYGMVGAQGKGGGGGGEEAVEV